MVKGSKEAKYWSDITPEMMSDEDRVEDKYVRHPPSFRSDKVSRFIHKLDSRLNRKGSDKARFVRVMGSPRMLPPPRNAKQWTIAQSAHVEDIQNTSAEALDSQSSVEADGINETDKHSDSEFSAGTSSDSECV